MNKKLLLWIIIPITLIIISVIIISNIKISYNKLVIDDNKWNSIINNKIYNNNIFIKEIKFNDYKLMIDNDNNIYYSIVNKNYNPMIDYVLSEKGLNIVFNSNISDNIINKDNGIKVLIYNDKYYRIYNLVIIDIPIISINTITNGNVKINI